MTEDRIEKLEAIDGWTWVVPNRLAWDVWSSVLKKYKQEQGDCLVLKIYPAYPKLGACAIADSNPEILNAAASAGVAATATVSSASLAENGQEITSLASVDLTKNAPVEGIAGDEEEIFAYILRCVITNKTPGIL